MALFEPLSPGPVTAGGERLVQHDGRTCGPSVVVAARAHLDPAFAATLEEPGVFARAQDTVHRAANRIWPRALGTTPWGVAATLNVHSGVRYRVTRDLARAREAAAAGWPVPVLVGARIPRHYVLLLGSDDQGRMLAYNPGRGRVVAADPDDLRPFGFPRFFAAVVPDTQRTGGGEAGQRSLRPPERGQRPGQEPGE